MRTHQDKINTMRLALDGLSIGDAFGQRFFDASSFMEFLPKRQLPPGPWSYTDDTEMALAIAEVLEDQKIIHQDELAKIFARRYQVDPHRGYGSGAHQLLRGINAGQDWNDLTHTLFGGEGSFGNGAAMRVAPIAGYFTDANIETVIDQAKLSAEISHAHEEGIQGAVAVALAGVWASRRTTEQPKEMFSFVSEFIPDGAIRRGIEEADEIDLSEDVRTASNFLGNGLKITARDTVPICLWAAAKNLDNFEEALWSVVTIQGDIDTNCAIVGGIVALAVGREGIPREWLETRESLWRYSVEP